VNKVSSLSSYRDLRVWQLGVALVAKTYEATKEFPTTERYGVTSQIQRAAVSIPANIAEGHARDSTKEFLHHISYSLGSLAELETLLHVANQLNYIPTWTLDELTTQCDELGKMIRGLQKSLKSKL
jgi:four helix bundle protein